MWRALLVPVVASVVLGAWLSAARPQDRAHGQGPSVVLFVGDGMGTAQISLGRMAARRLHREYALDRFRTMGLVETSASDNLVTESSAAATALASGVKTRNRTIGVDPEGRPLTTLVTEARAAGLLTGVVTTARVTDSTPAGFLAHASDRREEEEIARQYVAGAAPDVLLGGGGKHFDQARRDALRAKGHGLCSSRGGLLTASGPKVLGLFADDDMSYDVERDAGSEPSLAEMTTKALALLGGSDKRFFLMVEGGRIDHAGHLHDAPQVAQEQLAFAAAVGVALDRVERGERLLVLVTGDHATGSMGLTERLDLDKLLAVKKSVETIHAQPGCKEDDATLVRAVKEATGLDLDPAEVASVRRPTRPPAKVVALGQVVSKRLGVSFYEVDEQETQTITKGHEGVLVPLFAAGPGADAFAGTYENVEVPRRIAKALAIREPGAKLY